MLQVISSEIFWTKIVFRHSYWAVQWRTDTAIPITKVSTDVGCLTKKWWVLNQKFHATIHKIYMSTFHINDDTTHKTESGWLRRYSDTLRAGRYRDRIPLRARFSTPVQTGLGAHPASYTTGTGSFKGVKRPGRGVDHPPPSSAEVKERVELYLYSISGASWLVTGWPLPHFPIRKTRYR